MVNPDGTGLSEVRRVGRDGWASQGHAEWSSNGQELAMVGGIGGGTQIFVTTRAGAIVRQVTNRPGMNTDVSWTPNGQQLVFSGCSRTPCTPADVEIYMVSAFGGTETRLTTNTRPDYEPHFSPSAGDLVWVQKTADAGNGGLGTWGIMVRHTADGALRTLIDDGQVNSAPVWSADGTQLFFPRLEPAVSTRWRIFSIAFDGTGLRAITSASVGNSQYPGT
jgi:Tol biopolymer transport system component